MESGVTQNGEAAGGRQDAAAKRLVHGITEDNLAALPTGPGVYLFLGAPTAAQPAAELPLYIGKSVNIRARVLSHLRTPDEARLLAQTQRVEWLRTAGELGALLLESRLIKSRQPVFNQRLRRSRQLCAWQLPQGGPARPLLRYSRELDFATAPELFGLYSSAAQAQAGLLALAQAHQLCLVTLGREPAARRGCFARQLGRCAGACVGLETPADHHARLRAVLSSQAVQRWPFDGAVGLVERDGDWVQTQVVDRWRHVGTLEQGVPIEEAARRDHLARGPIDPGFDVDSYRILVKPVLTGQVVRLDWPGAAAG